jgi:sugar phosphate permease
MENKTQQKVNHIYYGWWIVFAGFIIVFGGVGAQSHMMNNFAEYARKLLGDTTSKIAIGISIFAATAFISNIIAGPVIDKSGPRKLMFVGIPLASISILALSFVINPTMFFLIWMLIGVGINIGFTLPAQKAIANWFVKKRSFAFSIICMATVLGPLVIKAGCDLIIPLLIWRGELIVLGVIMFVVIFPLVFVLRDKPEQLGLFQYGVTSDENYFPNETNTCRPGEIDFTLKQVLKSRSFWLLACCLVLIHIGANIVQFNRILFLVERGIATINIRTEFDSTVWWGMLGILAFGILGDKLPKRYLLAVVALLKILSIIVLLIISKTEQIFFYNIVNGISYGIMPLGLAIVADYFGRKRFATIIVATMILKSIGIIFVSILTGLIRMPFYSMWLGMFFCLLAGIFFIFAKPPKLNFT